MKPKTIFCTLPLATLLVAFGLTASAAVRYVDVNSASPTPPFTNWVTAATNIQDAVDGAVAGDEIVVTNGVYQTGGRAVGTNLLLNRVAVDKPLTVRSVNGPEVTMIRGHQLPGTTNGDGAVRCVYLTNGALLVGFTLSNGATRSSGDDREITGGGAWCASDSVVVSNCVLSGNSASEGGGGARGGTLNNCTFTCNSAYNGGGYNGGTLNNCTLTGNSAYNGGGACAGTLNNCVLNSNSAYFGGGAYTSGLGGYIGSTLNNCTLTGNSATYGGGAIGICRGHCFGDPNLRLNNCIVYDNTAEVGANYGGSSLDYCCTTPLPTNGVGNFTNAPFFVDRAGSNFRLQVNSPCINAGLNAYAPAGPDLDGNPRIVGGTVDIGAYEFQSPQSAISYAWLQSYGLPTDGSVDFTDGDGDGLNNWQEWRCLTDPTNALSALRLLTPTSGVTGVTVRWESVAGRNYFLERGTNFSAQPSFLPLASDIFGQAGTTTYLDTNAAGAGPWYYRVGVLP